MIEFNRQFSIDSPSGAKLNVYAMEPEGTARGIIHINHGLAEHAVRYARFADALSNAGFVVFAHDHRGHGYTKAADAPQGVFSTDGNGVDKVMADCAAVQAHARADHSELPIIMFGHSMGGLITMNYALRHADQLAGAAVWNANFDGGIVGRLAQGLLKYERLRLGSDVPSRILPKLTFQTWAKQIKDRRTEFDWLSHINEEVDAYVADPLCGWDASVGLWMDLFEMIFAGADVASHAADLRGLPLNFTGGRQDPATNGGSAVEKQWRRINQTTENTAASCKIYPDTRHETLNDLVAPEATAAFIEFANFCCEAKRT